MRWRRQSQEQRNALREMADQIRREDPQLAKLLADGLGSRRVSRLASPSLERMLAVLGAILFVAGAYLSLGSSLFCGLGLIAYTVIRHRRRKQHNAGAGAREPRARTIE